MEKGQLGIITEKRRLELMRSIRTVAQEFNHDKLLYNSGEMSQEELIQHYGHLRPGTYELTNQAYWEDPERYFHCEPTEEAEGFSLFKFSAKETNKIQLVLSELGTSLTVSEFTDYLKRAIQLREKVKFEFTCNLSRALDACIEFAKESSI